MFNILFSLFSISEYNEQGSNCWIIKPIEPAELRIHFISLLSCLIMSSVGTKLISLEFNWSPEISLELYILVTNWVQVKCCLWSPGLSLLLLIFLILMGMPKRYDIDIDIRSICPPPSKIEPSISKGLSLE